MDSLVLEEPGAAGKKPAITSPLSPMANGGRYLLSPPTSPGAMSVGSSYENTSPAFSPLSSPASSGSCASHSPSGQEPASSTPPLVPARSSSYHLALQPPQSRPSGARSSESPRLGRKGVHERPPSPGLRGLLTDSPASTVLAEARRTTESPRLCGQLPLVAISLSEYSASGAHSQPTSIPGSPKFQSPVPAPLPQLLLSNFLVTAVCQGLSSGPGFFCWPLLELVDTHDLSALDLGAAEGAGLAL